ncbi:dan glycosylase [Bacillus sp. OxB-1]|uniref:A/G-specific adenine glycosylase n=1 Tax=Bacillus sp. (strain OxB-1) TaxID=98228 RepID=UPI000581CD54|nr:A/G-specific adenine glycosylase [Bacillus sp. OxB-1]BAQ08717.1 dan glycosylase [Bacillus sp. OxB-1]
MQVIEQKDIFRQSLLSWYHHEKREMPWRKTKNPYYIWVSEVMLQQTRVETVIPYYERFIQAYPTMEELANADEEELLKMWEGLGYYSRARNLQTGVREVLEKYGGEVPATRKEISTLKGVGPYTAGAVLSIAYGVPEHAVDGNVMRVLSRILLIEDDIALPRTRKVFEGVVMDLIDQEDPSSFNQALMELGATICIPRPRCLLCPVRDFCAAFQEGRQEELPVKSKKTKTKITSLSAFALQNETGEWLLRKRPEKGLLANMWEFPMIENKDGLRPAQLLQKSMNVEADELKGLLSFKHVFSHITWEVESYQGRMRLSGSLPEGYEFFSAEEVQQLPKAKPVIKMWDAIQHR